MGTREPDLLIADLRLRDKEQGASLAIRLRPLYGDFPVLIVTGKTAPEALQQANADNFPLLQKPITCDALFEVICKLLER